MRKLLLGYSISLERKKQYSQSRLQIAPLGFASRWKAQGASFGKSTGSSGYLDEAEFMIFLILYKSYKKDGSQRLC